MDLSAFNICSSQEGSVSDENEFDRAFKNRDFQAMKKLIFEKKVNLNDNEKLFLHSVIFNQDSDMLEFILCNGGDPNIRDSKGRTALYKAICNFAPGPVEILMKHDADMTDIEKETGKDALSTALQQRCLLEDEDLPPEFRQPLAQNNIIIESILRHGMHLGDEIQANNYKLCNAIVKGDSETAEKFIAEGKGISSMSLESAVIENKMKIAELLLVKGASPNNKSIVFSAVKGKNFEMLKLLCLYKIELNVTDKDSFSPLCHTVGRGLDWVKLLIDHGADVKRSVHALHQACSFGKLEVVKLLLQHNADVNCRGVANNTPLHEAVGYPEIVKCLLENGAEVNARNSSGQTPTDQAAGLVLLKLGALQSIRLLKEYGGQMSSMMWKCDSCFDEGNSVYVVDFKFNKGMIDVDAKKENGDNVSFTCKYEKFVEVLGGKKEEFPVVECVKRLQEDGKKFLQDINSADKKNESN